MLQCLILILVSICLRSISSLAHCKISSNTLAKNSVYLPKKLISHPDNSYYKKSVIFSSPRISPIFSYNPFLSTGSDIASVRNEKPTPVSLIKQGAKRVLSSILFPVIVQLMLVYAFGLHPAAAAIASQSVTGQKGAKQTYASTPSVSLTPAAAAKSFNLAKVGKIFQKIFLGVYSKGTYKQWKAGDTRSDMVLAINGITMIIIVGIIGIIAGQMAKLEERQQLERMRKEVSREREYREKMYYEAVEEILKKLGDPKVKSSVKADLSKQLKDLDPDGSIRAFLAGNGSKPDMSTLMGSSSSNKNKSSTSAGIKRPKPPSATGKRVSDANPRNNKFGKGEEEEEDGEDEDFEEEEEEEENDDEDESADSSPVNPLTSRPARREVSKSDTRSPSSPSTPSNINRKGASQTPKGPSPMMKVLKELDDSLAEVLAPTKRKALLTMLKQRLEAISTDEKREAALKKIAERLGDDDYWVEYAKRV